MRWALWLALLELWIEETERRRTVRGESVGDVVDWWRRGRRTVWARWVWIEHGCCWIGRGLWRRGGTGQEHDRLSLWLCESVADECSCWFQVLKHSPFFLFDPNWLSTDYRSARSVSDSFLVRLTLDSIWCVLCVCVLLLSLKILWIVECSAFLLSTLFIECSVFSLFTLGFFALGLIVFFGVHFFMTRFEIIWMLCSDLGQFSVGFLMTRKLGLLFVMIGPDSI